MLALGSAADLSRSASVQAQDQQVSVIELTAKKYEYSPSPVHVKAGTKVQLKSQPRSTIMVLKSHPFPMAPQPAANPD